MTIHAIPYELGRFYVESRTRPEITHVVDLMWQEERWQRPHGACSCEAFMAQGLVCAHLREVTKHELERLKL